MKKTSFVSKVLILTVLTVWFGSGWAFAQVKTTLSGKWSPGTVLTTQTIASTDDGAVLSIAKGTAYMTVAIPRAGIDNPDPAKDSDWEVKQTLTITSTDANPQTICYKGSKGLCIKAQTANPGDVKVEFKAVCGL